MQAPIQILLNAGVTLRIDEHGKLKASPGRLYTSELQAYVRERRAAIVAHLLTVPTVPCVATRSRQDVPAPLGEATTTPTTAKATDAAYWPWELADLRGGQP